MRIVENGKLYFRYPFRFLNNLSACPRCKWIGSSNNMGYLFLEERNYLDETKKIKSSCCPNCGNYVGILTTHFLGIMNFIECYLKKDILEEIEINHIWYNKSNLLSYLEE